MSTSGATENGGAAIFPNYAGAGSPEGVVTAAPGKSYEDTTNGAIYWKTALGGTANTGWVCGNVVPTGNLTTPTLGFRRTDEYALVLGKADSAVIVSDVDGWNGTGNGISWLANGTDGQQYFSILVGSAGQYETQFTAAGLLVLPGGITTKPASSNAATAAYGQVAADTPRRNTTGYDILVSGTIEVSAATAGTLGLGVGSGATPTTNPIVTALTVATNTIVPFSAIVPNTYYLSIVSGGTITIGAITSVVTPL